MAEQLFIRLDEPTGTCSSIVLDADGRAVRGTRRGALADVAADAEGRRVVLLVPGPDVVTTRVGLPSMSPGRLRQTLPYSLEDQFAEDVERLQFASGRRLPSGEVPVSVVAHGRLQAWLERLSELGIVPHAVYADTDGVPDTPSTLSIVVDGPRVYGRRPGGAPFVLEDLPLVSVLDLTAAEDDAEEIRHVDLYVDAAEEPALRAEVEALVERGASVEPRVLGDGVVGRLAMTLVFAPGTNLRQGPYAPKSNVAALARPWLPAAGLAAGLLVLAFVSKGATYVELSREDRALTEWLNETCRSAFSVSDPSVCETEVRRRLSAAGMSTTGGGETFLSVLATVAEHNDPANRLQALSYRNGEMTLELTTENIPALDEFAQRIESTERFMVRIQSANPREDGVEGRVRLVEAQR